MSDEKRETVSDIVAQMRGRGEDGRMDMSLWRDYADRIEAAWKLERAEIEEQAADKMLEGATIIDNRGNGNAAAMRDVSQVAEEMTRGTIKGESVDRKTVDAWAMRLCEIISRDLAIPLRNCDVGTAEEQAGRMRQFCTKQKRNGIINCGYCPIKHQYERDCTLDWAQMPYEAQEGGSK
jgi:hypothetical protein